MRRLGFITLFALMALEAVVAQWGGYRGGGWDGDSQFESFRSPREIPQHSYETPMWTNSTGFDKDVFTFVRMKRGYLGAGGRGGWSTDTPDADLNLAYRLQQVTSMKVAPNGLFLPSTDNELAEYPFISMVEP